MKTTTTRPVVVLALAASLLGASACSGAGEPAAPTASSVSPSPTSVATTSATVPTPAPSSPSTAAVDPTSALEPADVYLVACGKGEVSVYTVPLSGEGSGAVTFPSDFGCRDVNGFAPLVTYTLRQRFSHDFTKFAETREASDGTDHVGWIDEAGDFTDVSALLQPNDDFSERPRFSEPFFDPVTGDFLFYDGKAFNRVDPDDPSTVIGKTRKDSSDYRIDPSGRLYSVDDVTGTCVRDTTGTSTFTGGISTSSDEPSFALTWPLDKHRMVANAGQDDGYIATVAPSACGTMGKTTRLTPSTDLDMSCPVPTADGEHVAFIGRRGDQWAIYQVGAKPGTKVKKIFAFEDGSIPANVSTCLLSGDVTSG